MPTLLQQARFVLGELGIRPHKRLGQHFLVDSAVVDRMVKTAHIGPEDRVLEIGPGLGALSDVLAEVAGQLYLVELDPVLAARLRERFARDERVQVLTADFLSLDTPTIFPHSPIRVVASLPYNVATPILFRLLEHRYQFPDATVMLQKEVAERVSATPGTKAYGVLSILIQLYAEVTAVCTVNPRSFFPVPQVQSKVVRIVFQDAPRVVVHNTMIFQRLVRAAFAQRRKTLRNALRAAGYPDLDPASARVGVDLQRRGETLSLGEFAALTNEITREKSGPDGTLDKKSPGLGEKKTVFPDQAC